MEEVPCKADDGDATASEKLQEGTSQQGHTKSGGLFGSSGLDMAPQDELDVARASLPDASASKTPPKRDSNVVNDVATPEGPRVVQHRKYMEQIKTKAQRHHAKSQEDTQKASKAKDHNQKEKFQRAANTARREALRLDKELKTMQEQLDAMTARSSPAKQKKVAEELQLESEFNSL